MLTDLDCATLCWSCYNDVGIFDRVIEFDGVWAGIKHYEDCSAIAFRGSSTLQDWIRDFEGLMVNDPAIGCVEQGFMRGMRDVIAHAADEINTSMPKIYVTGHSLGAARALIFSGLVAAMGLPKILQRCVTFGSPRPGGAKLKEVLAPVEIHSYKNGDDPVTEVPIAFPLFPYAHPRDLIMVDVPPAAGDMWGVLARHHSELYVQAMKGLQNG